MRDKPFDRDRLIEAFGHLGADLAGRGAFLELAVYGGSALILQFAWRRGAEDAVLRPGYDERRLAPSVARVSEIMGLPGDWLNDAVGTPGLRALVATPHHRLAMKLLALGDADRGDRDMTDARALARETGVGDVDALSRPSVSIHGERPADDLMVQFQSVLGQPDADRHTGRGGAARGVGSRLGAPPPRVPRCLLCPGRRPCAPG